MNGFQGLLPKRETQSLEFSKTHNGKNIVIAILDTGVDPAAPGLQTTPHGLSKITNIIDCTGTGDVYGTLVSIQEKTVQGLSGRELKLGNWNIKDNQVYLGLKSANDLFPKDLVERLSRESRVYFDVQHSKLVTEVHVKLQEAQKNLLNCKNEEKQDFEKWVEEYKARLDCLKEEIKAFETAPLVYDCVWFNDGNVWRAVVDTGFSGDLSKNKLLAEYNLEQEYSSFGVDSMLNFSVNFYDGGKVLSIVTTSGAHGTHVAAISAAYFPGQEELNGVAPGAQIVSLKIGDNRLGSMETGRGLVRAANEMVRLKVDIANMSYGEACTLPNYGTFLNLLTKEVVNKANIVFVTSAGNAGPALSTVGAPGGFASGVISVGAFVTASMMEAEYALLKNVTERPYTWSSRGPALDGDVGVDIYAPGAAITSVPQFTIQNSQLMNGTSMASPNCCGCISLLLSALKAEKRIYTPYLIKRAIQNSGKDIGDCLSVKFIQVKDAWDYLLKVGNLSNFHLDYNVSIGSNRGVYLRDAEETSRLNSFNVSVTPNFINNDHPSQNETKLKMEVKLEFKSSHSWIKVPKNLHLNAGGRTFGIHIDPTFVEPGAYFGRISAYDIDNQDSGPLFNIPVAVCKPEPLSTSMTSSSNSEVLSGYIKYSNLEFAPGHIKRKFIAVPSGSNYLEIRINAANRDFTARFYAHIIQLLPQSRYNQFEHDLSFALNSNNSGSQSDSPTYSKWLRVIPNVTMELCLAQFWSSLDRSNVTVELKFHGIFCTASGNALGGYGSSAGCFEELSITSGITGFTRIDVSAMIRKQEISPSVSLETIRRVIRPSEESSVVALQSRDVHPDGKQAHALELTYTFKLDSDVSVTPQFPQHKHVLYESSLDNFCVLLFDNNKRLLSYQDIYPKAIKLSEGTYTIKVQVSSIRVEALDNLVNMPLVLDISMSKSATLPIATSIGELTTGNPDGVFKKKTLQRGDRVCFFVGNSSSLPKEVKYGDILLGKLDILEGKKLDGPMYNVQYLVPPDIPKFEGKKSVDELKKEDQLIREAVRDLEISWLSKLKSDDLRSSLSIKLCAEFPSHLPLHHQNLEIEFDKMDKSESIDENLCRKVIELSDKVISIISQDELAKYFGVSHENKTPAEKEISSAKDKGKSSLIYALIAKATAIQKLNVNNSSRPSEKTLDDFDSILKNLCEWVGDKPKLHDRYLLLWSWRQNIQGFSGTSLLAIIKFLQEKKDVDSRISRKLLDMKMNIFEKLEWKVWDEAHKRWNLLKFPKDYASF